MNKKEENKKELLLETAKIIISEKSYNEMNIKDLTECCGISKSTFYHYFKSKEELYFLVIENMIEEHLKEIKNLNFVGNLKEDLTTLINFKLNISIVEIKIMKKEILSGFHNINSKNIKKFQEIIDIFHGVIKKEGIDTGFLIVSLMAVVEEFIILQNNKLSKKEEFNRLKNFEIKNMEKNKKYVSEQILKMFLAYIGEDK